MKLAVIIPAHCHPDILRLTLGSLIRTFTRHDLEIHVGFHFNYSDYCQDRSIFDDLRGIASVHLVDEIDWNVHGRDINRYSLMHAKHVAFLLKQIRYDDFDYVLLLDNDVLVRDDFVAELRVLQRGNDLIGVIFRDLDGGHTFERGDGTPCFAMPKISPWHLLISKRLYARLLGNLSLIEPRDISPGSAEHAQLSKRYQVDPHRVIFQDTFAGVLDFCKYVWQDMRVQTLSTSSFGAWAEHFFFSSFNYGRLVNESQANRIRDVYAREFPDGVAGTFAHYRG